MEEARLSTLFTGEYDSANKDGHDGRLELARRFAAKHWRSSGREIRYLGSLAGEKYFGTREK